MLDQLHPHVADILAAQHAAGLTATIEPATGGGYQIHLPGPFGTYALVGGDEVLPEADEEPTALHAQLYDFDGEFLDVVFHRCTDSTCGQPGCGKDASLDPAPLAAALAQAIDGRRPGFIPRGSLFFNQEGIRFTGYFDRASHEVRLVRDLLVDVPELVHAEPAATLGDAENVLRKLGYALASEWAGPMLDGCLYCYLLRPGA
ncbi:hypothetical protein [Kitasatospora sp. NPDC059327]|uniref:hypothetical protein n=1 Tax=Kitasatospora sp. NPDC059327 TaxID=3346803 RepID=UPI0036BF2936